MDQQENSKMHSESGISYCVQRFGVFHRILQQKQYVNHPKKLLKAESDKPEASSTWLRLILMFWNFKVMRAALRFGVAALIMNHYERLGFATLILCFAL